MPWSSAICVPELQKSRPKNALRTAAAMKENGLQRREDRGSAADGGNVPRLRGDRHPVMVTLASRPIGARPGGYRVQGRDDAERAPQRPMRPRSQDAGRVRGGAGAGAEAPLRVADHEVARDPDRRDGAGPASTDRSWCCTTSRLNDHFSAKFVKKYAALAEDVREAARVFAAEVREAATRTGALVRQMRLKNDQ